MDGEEQRACPGNRCGLALPSQELVDVGLVAPLVGKRDAADDAVDHLNLLEGERDLVEIAEDQLVERQLRLGDSLVEIHLAMPPRGLGGIHREELARDAKLDPDDWRVALVKNNAGMRKLLALYASKVKGK